jgi:hypothetical protein
MGGMKALFKAQQEKEQAEKRNHSKAEELTSPLDSQIPRFPDSQIPNTPESRNPDSQLQIASDSQIPGPVVQRFPDSQIPRFPDSQTRVLKTNIRGNQRKLSNWINARKHALLKAYCIQQGREMGDEIERALDMVFASLIHGWPQSVDSQIPRFPDSQESRSPDSQIPYSSSTTTYLLDLYSKLSKRTITDKEREAFVEISSHKEIDIELGILLARANADAEKHRINGFRYCHKFIEQAAGSSLGDFEKREQIQNLKDRYNLGQDGKGKPRGLQKGSDVPRGD